MAIIYSYPINTNILATDIIIGSSTAIVNGKPKNQTKSFEIQDLATYFASIITPPGSYVPYNGATGPVNLGSQNLTANSIIKAGGTNLQFLKADGSVDSSTYVGGSGTVSYIPKFSSASGITNSILQDSGTGTITLDATPTNVAALALKPGNGQASLVQYFFNNTVRFQTGSDASGNYRINVYNAVGSFVNCALLVPSATTRVLINSVTDDGVNNLQVNGSLIATSIKKTGGTVFEYLMANGSVTTNGTLYSAVSTTYQTAAGVLQSISAAIPSNIFTNGNLLKLNAVITTTAASVAIATIEFYINSAATTVGATLIGRYNGPIGNQYIPIDRFFWVSGTTLYGRDFTASASTSTSNSTFAINSVAIPATQFYIIAQVTTTSTDRACISTIKIEKS